MQTIARLYPSPLALRWTRVDALRPAEGYGLGIVLIIISAAPSGRSGLLLPRAGGRRGPSQRSVHYRAPNAQFGHNLTTLKFDSFPSGTGDDAGSGKFGVAVYCAFSRRRTLCACGRLRADVPLSCQLRQ